MDAPDIPDRRTESDLPDYVLRNRAAWDSYAPEFQAPGRRCWESAEPLWGVWSIPESQVRLLPEVSGLDTIELGCGTAYVSAWLARRGARPVGIDNSPAQLENARAFQTEFQLDFPLLFGNAESVPLPDATFDLAISEYGASIWCDPYRWIPEAARLLRPRGRLVFLVNTPLLMLVTPDEDDVPAGIELRHSYFGMHRWEWPDDPAVEFHLTHGDMLRLLRRCGFEVEDLIELRPPEGSTTLFPLATLEWARRWPCEEVWVARK